MYMKKLLVILLGLLTMEPCSADLYRVYQTNDGLSHNSVWAVMQDSQGFMWFGTNDGLNRFDGVSFKIYRRQQSDSQSIGNNFIHCLLEDRAGSILVGTKEGLYQYRQETEQFRHISLNGKPVGQDRTSVHSLVQDKSGNIWVGCYGQGIYVLNADYQIMKHYDEHQLPSRFINTLAFDMAGKLWAGTDGKGLFCLNAKTGRGVSAFDNGTVQSIYCDNNNILWIGTATEGLIRYDHRAGVIRRLDGQQTSRAYYNIKAITAYQPNILVMSSEAGLLKLDSQTETLEPFNDALIYDNLPDYSIFAIAKDKEDGLWLGTYFYGVSYWSPRINSFSYYAPQKNSPGWSNSIVKRMALGTQGDVWLSTRNFGLVRYNTESHTMKSFPVQGITHNLQELMVDGQQLWINDYDRRLVVVDIPTGRIVKEFSTANGLPSNIVNTLCKTSDGRIFIGTSKGVSVYHNGTLERLSQIPEGSVMKIIEDYDGSIWMAMHFHGVIHLLANGTVKQYVHSPADSLSVMGNNINTVFQDTQGHVWIGTEGEGLGLFNQKTGRMERIFNEGNGLPSNIIYAIQEDAQGMLWVSTSSGLIKMNPKKDYYVHQFRYIESLVNIHYLHNSFLRDARDRLYFGGSSGFISFNPADITDSDIPPVIQLTDLYINGKRTTQLSEDTPLDNPLNSTDQIELSASQNTFSFDVACLSYVSPEEDVIAYQLVGFDKTWKYLPAGQRHILYMNIPSGHYTLQVKAINTDGVESDPVMLDIEVNPPFLLSRWMLFVYALTVILLTLYTVRRYKRRLEAANQEKMLKFSMDKEKELYEAKIGFFTNIAHEIRTPLSLICAPLEALLASKDGNEKTRANLTVMRSNVQRLLELVNQLLDFRKVESQLMTLNIRPCQVSDIVLSIARRYEEFVRLHEMTLDTSAVTTGIVANLDEEAFKKIVGNLISNATKFANRQIIVSLVVQPDTKNMELRVTDDGPGIKQEDQQRIFESFYQVDDHGKRPGSGLGLPLALNLAKMHGGDISVESAYGHGSTFILTLPTTLSAEEAVETTTSQPDEEPTETVTTTETIQVLFVEDNDELRQFVSENLGEGFRVYCADNGVEALRQLEEHNVDIIVSDIMMPEMDGLELCRVLKQGDTYAHIPLILLSAKSDMETKVGGLEVGAAAYLEKPFTMQQLRAQISSIIEDRNQLREQFIKSPLDFYRKPHSDDTQEKQNAEFVNRLNQLILENLTNSDFTIDGLARMFLMSRSNFHKRLKGVTGETPNDYIRIVRLNKSAELLATGKYQIVEVCYMVGFNTPSYFSKCFQEHFGKLPKEYINDLNQK